MNSNLLLLGKKEAAPQAAPYIYLAASGNQIDKNGDTYGRLMRVNDDKRADGWNPQPNNFINTMECDGQNLYVGGYFTSIGGQSRLRLAKINIDTGEVDTSWIVNTNGTVWKVKSDINNSNLLHVCGAFTSIGGQARHGYALVNKTTGAVESLSINFSGGICYDVEMWNTTHLFVVGTFNSVDGSHRRGFAKVSRSNGSVDTSWPSLPFTRAPESNPYVGGRTVKRVGNRIVFSGRNRTSDGTWWYTFAADPINGGFDSTFNNNVIERTSFFLVTTQNHLYFAISSAFGRTGGTRRAHRTNYDGNNLQTVDPSYSGEHHDGLVSGDYFYVAGGFGVNDMNIFRRYSLDTLELDTSFRSAEYLVGRGHAIAIDPNGPYSIDQ